jgi:hypothetical protein
MVSFSMLLLNGNEANYIYEQHAILFIFFFRFELFLGVAGASMRAATSHGKTRRFLKSPPVFLIKINIF